jgi:glucose/arabinose dehydrogenase
LDAVLDPQPLDRAALADEEAGVDPGGVRAATVSEPPPGAVFPVVETAAHATDLGLAFYEGGMFPAGYRGALSVAQRGSSVRRAGGRAGDGDLPGPGRLGARAPALRGGLAGRAAGRYRGRIADVAAVLPDGSLPVSEDEAGALYRVTHDGAAR